MARPSKLNHDLIAKAYELVKEGLPVIYVCDNLSIRKQSYYNWMEKGEKDFEEEIESLEAEFFDYIKKGVSEYVQEAVRTIKKGEKGWQGSAWLLERTRKEFMPKQEIKAGDDGKVTVILGGKVKDIKKNDNNQ